MSLTWNPRAEDGEVQDCRLLNLPKELRVMIYGFYFGEVQRLELNDREDYCELPSWDIYSSWCLKSDAGSALLRTCRIVCLEAYQILVDRTHVVFNWDLLKYDPEECDYDLEGYGSPLYLGSITRVCFFSSLSNFSKLELEICFKEHDAKPWEQTKGLVYFVNNCDSIRELTLHLNIDHDSTKSLNYAGWMMECLENIEYRRCITITLQEGPFPRSLRAETVEPRFEELLENLVRALQPLKIEWRSRNGKAEKNTRTEWHPHLSLPPKEDSGDEFSESDSEEESDEDTVGGRGSVLRML